MAGIQASRRIVVLMCTERVRLRFRWIPGIVLMLLAQLSLADTEAQRAFDAGLTDVAAERTESAG